MCLFQDCFYVVVWMSEKGACFSVQQVIIRVYTTNHPILSSFSRFICIATGDVNNKAICRMCKVVGVDLNGKMYKLAETGEFKGLFLN